MARRERVEEEQAQNLPAIISSGLNMPMYMTGERSGTNEAGEIRTSNRVELIECIKRGEKPTWVPSANLQALYDQEKSSVHRDDHRHRSDVEADVKSPVVEDPFFGPWTEAGDGSKEPRPAFHRGNFNGPGELSASLIEADVGFPSTRNFTSMSSTSLPWLSTADSSPIGQAFSTSKSIQGMPNRSASRRRAPSLGSSLSSSFVLRTPTSPLAYALNNTSLENNISDDPITNNYSIDKPTRRRTMPPNSFHFWSISPTEAALVNYSRPLPPLSHESTMRHVSHQPRRSLSSFTYHSSSNPQTPQIRSRRQSFASDMSPRRRTSMVGSFEESILRGRMSSPASQPFDFVAQIGVMGKGDCPVNLKCPAHVSVPFQAVYYHYPASLPGQSISDEAPSPYVGTIDIQNNLKPVHLITKRKWASALGDPTCTLNNDPRAPENTSIGKALARDAEEKKQRSNSPQISLGGAYRVPQKGQVQIVVKNQNKTAVKLFLVPYDLEGMEAGTKTFVRQRSYSRGPIIEGALDSTAGSASLNDPLKDKHILRYLVHLRFCCPSKGKYYLNDHIRVVFANRVPDGKEKLENDLQLPDPKFSPYRPLQTQRKSLQQSPGEFSNTDSRSSNFDGVFHEPHSAESFESLSFLPQSLSSASQADPRTLSEPEELVQLPINLAPRNSVSARVSEASNLGEDVARNKSSSFCPNEDLMNTMIPETSRALSPVQGFLPSTSTRASPLPWASSSTSSTTRSFSPVPVEVGNGLLSRQFRDLYNAQVSADPSDDQINEALGESELGTSKHQLKNSDKSNESAAASSIEEHSELGDISLAITHGVDRT